ncbi:venom metalloproteinase antarease TserMP_A-like [Tachypleus tridentatus]|uniref:venom metalloproteinase antarease TserMP_A-like n=1 Tax=Tachypleus tridentatus TaxID=6853 RepID=UPI003FD6324B
MSDTEFNFTFMVIIFIVLLPQRRCQENIIPRIRINQDGTRVTLELPVHNRLIRLNLILTTGLFQDNFEVASSDHSSNYKPDLKMLNKVFFTDSDKGSSLHIKKDSNGLLKIEGVLGDGLRVAPSNDTVSLSNEGVAVHKVMTVKENSVTMPDTFVPGISLRRIQPQRPDNSESVKVELLAVMDSVHRKFFASEQDIIKYFGVFYNAVNLRYLSLKNPSIKIVLAGISYTSNSTQELHVYNNDTGDGVLASKALRVFSNYKSKGKEQIYDISILTTGRDLVDTVYEKRTASITGITWIGGACNELYRYAIAEDTPGLFDGIDTHVHEIAHLLGAIHDGDGPPVHMPDSPGAKMCPQSEGYVMSYVDGGLNKFRFSSCSKDQFQYFLGLEESTCLKSETKPTQIHLSQDLPGQVIPNERRCQLLHPDIRNISVYNNPYGQECKLYCRQPEESDGFKYHVHAGLDGTPCGNNMKICLLGECVQPGTPPTQEEKPSAPPSEKNNRKMYRVRFGQGYNIGNPSLHSGRVNKLYRRLRFLFLRDNAFCRKINPMFSLVQSHEVPFNPCVINCGSPSIGNWFLTKPDGTHCGFYG